MGFQTIKNMRLLLSLRAEKSFSYESNYFNKIQGFIYNILRDSAYAELHNKQGFKFFCFSNIFPSGRDKIIEEGSIKQFIISSPDNGFMTIVKESLPHEINIGEMQFSLIGAKQLTPNISKNCVVKTATPIIIRIPQYKYAEYGISSQYSYVFWKPEHDFNAFLKQLSENVIKKYNEYHKEKVEEQPLFQQFMYDGSYPIHPIIDKKEQTFIGSYWKFVFQGMTEEQQEFLQFALDCGFGELNSLGFGFVNVVR